MSPEKFYNQEESEGFEKRVFLLSELTEEQKISFKERAAKFDGTIRFFMHPFFANDFGDYYHASKTEDKGDAYSSFLVLGRCLSLPPENTPPIVVADVEEKISETSKLCTEWSKNSKNSSYLLPTYPNSPVPNFYHSQKFDNKSLNKEWQKLIDLFKELGVKNILLSGMYLSEYSEELHSKTGKISIPISVNGKDANVDFANECIVSIIDCLGEDFDIEMSNATYPMDRKRFFKHLKSSALGHEKNN